MAGTETDTERAEPDYDVLIVGGGPAGMSAALQLGRSLREVLLCDDDEPRNRPSSTAHGYLTRDGVAPDEFRQLGRAEITAYDTVEHRRATVTAVTKEGEWFVSTFEDGSTCSSRKCIVATGVVDQLPDIEGFEQLWGTSVVHCPYCHGYEVRDQALGVHVDSPEKVAMVKLVSNLSTDLIVFTDGHDVLDDETHAAFTDRGIEIESEPIVALSESSGTLECVVLEGGREIPRQALFYGPAVSQRGAFIEQFDLSIDDRGLVETGADGRTDVDGLFVAGDASNTRKPSLVFAAAGGSEIGAAVNAELSFEAF